MRIPAASGSGSTDARSGAPFLAWAIGALLLAACDGGLGYRSVAEMADKVPISHGVTRVRIEIQNGTVGVEDVLDAADRSVHYAGGIRRAADTAEELQRLEQIPFQLTGAIDASRPDTLVLRGPHLPPGTNALLAYELGVRVPAELAVDVVVESNGHVTVGHRRGALDISTQRGDLRFEHCSAPVHAKTGRGNVIAFDHAGDLDLRTEVGDMQAFVRAPGTKLVLGTGKGTVQVFVPMDCGFSLDARAEVGRIGADFGLSSETVGRYGAALVGKHGDEHTNVVLRTGAGHLAFRAKKFD